MSTVSTINGGDPISSWVQLIHRSIDAAASGLGHGIEEIRKRQSFYADNEGSYEVLADPVQEAHAIVHKAMGELSDRTQGLTALMHCHTMGIAVNDEDLGRIMYPYVDNIAPKIWRRGLVEQESPAFLEEARAYSQRSTEESLYMGEDVRPRHIRSAIDLIPRESFDHQSATALDLIDLCRKHLKELRAFASEIESTLQPTIPASRQNRSDPDHVSNMESIRQSWTREMSKHHEDVITYGFFWRCVHDARKDSGLDPSAEYGEAPGEFEAFQIRARSEEYRDQWLLSESAGMMSLSKVRSGPGKLLSERG